MGNYYTQFVWSIDALLLAVVVFLSALTLTYAFFKQILEERRYGRLKRIEENLRKMAIADGGAMKTQCPVLIQKTTSSQFFEIAKRTEEILPKAFSKQLAECITDSGKVFQIEKTAQRARNKWRRIEALIALGTFNSLNAVDILGKSVLDRDEDVAYFSMLTLGHIKTPEAARILLEALKKRIFSPYKIASILEHFPPSILETLLQATEDPDPLLRSWALTILARFKPKSCVQSIYPRTSDPAPEVRAAACECLGELAEEGAQEAVARCLKDNAWFVRMHAVRALEKIGGARCIPEVASLIQDNHESVRRSVKEVLKKHVEHVLPVIEKFLASNNLSVRQYGLEILDESGYIRRILQEMISEDAKAKNNALRLLAEMLKAGGHFGFENFLRRYPKDTREKILAVMATIDRQQAEHIAKKISGQIVEY